MTVSTHKNKYGGRSRRLNITEGQCYYCKTSLDPEINYCESCGFPQKGGETEQRVFIGNQRKKISELEELIKLEKGGRQVLFLLAGLNLIVAGVQAFVHESLPDTIAYLVITGLYAGLGYLSRKKPFQALVAGLVLYLTFIAIYALVDITTLYSGPVIKLVMILGLASGINSIRKAEKLRKEIEGKNLYGN